MFFALALALSFSHSHSVSISMLISFCTNCYREEKSDWTYLLQCHCTLQIKRAEIKRTHTYTHIHKTADKPPKLHKKVVGPRQTTECGNVWRTVGACSLACVNWYLSNGHFKRSIHGFLFICCLFVPYRSEWTIHGWTLHNRSFDNVRFSASFATKWIKIEIKINRQPNKSLSHPVDSTSKKHTERQQHYLGVPTVFAIPFIEWQLTHFEYINLIYLISWSKFQTASNESLWI